MEGILIYFGALGAFAIGVLWRPPIALAAFLSLFALKQWGVAKIGMIASNHLITNYLIAAIVILALGRAALSGRLRSPVVGDLTLWVLLLYGYAALSTLWSPAPDRALDELQSNLPYVLIGVLAMPMLLRTTQSVEEGLWALIAVGAPLMAAFVFLVTWDYRAIVSEVVSGETIRLPLSLAQFAGYVFVAAALLSRGTLFKYIVLAGCAALAVAIAVRTGSRGQFLTMVACAGMLLPASQGRHGSFRTVFALATVAILAIGAFSIYADTTQDVASTDQRWSSEDFAEDYEGRLETSTRLLGIWASDPFSVIFGMGSSASFSSYISSGYSHILFVDVLSELGLIGFTLLCILLWRCASVTYAALKSVTPTRTQMRRNAVVATMIAIFLMEFLLSLKQGTLLRNSYLFAFPILLQGILAMEVLIKQYAKARAEAGEFVSPIRA